MKKNNDAHEPLDMETLSASFMNDANIINTILQAFQDSFGTFEDQFRTAEGDGDRDGMRHLAHAIKGSAGNIRASLVADQAATLEQQLTHNAGAEQIHQSFDSLLHALDDLNHYIDDLKK